MPFYPKLWGFNSGRILVFQFDEIEIFLEWSDFWFSGCFFGFVATSGNNLVLSPNIS